VSDRPIPIPDQDSTPFWTATADRRLLVQHCENCGRNQLYPRLYCRYCHSEKLDWEEASGRGRIYSLTVVRRAPSPAFADAVPYPIALVDLEEGPRVMANILGADPDEPRIGRSVTLDWVALDEGLAMPAFRLATEEPVAEPTTEDARTTTA
jgi:uncharacterized protein